jgi:hypothetical protein
MATKIVLQNVPFFQTKENIDGNKIEYFIPVKIPSRKIGEPSDCILIPVEDEKIISKLIQLNPIPAFMHEQKGIVTMRYHS